MNIVDLLSMGMVVSQQGEHDCGNKAFNYHLAAAFPDLQPFKY